MDGGTNQVKKRKASRDIDLRSGKPLIDAYSKRSKTLVEKGEELTKSTDAFVVVYTARPETVGEGNHRFFMSNNLQNADPSFAERISKDLNTAAIQIAGRSFLEGRPHKTSRAHTIRGNSAMVPSMAERIPSSDTAIHSTQTSRGLDVIGAFISSCAARSASAAGIVQPKQFPLEEHGGIVCRPPEVSQEVSLSGIAFRAERFSDDSSDNQLFGLAMIKSLVHFDCGVKAVSESMAIPRLIRLLDLNSGQLQDVARQSALVLFSMSRHQQPCRQMITEGILLALSRLLSQSIEDDELLAVIAQTIRVCTLQQRNEERDTVHDTITTFRAVLQSLIKFLDSKDPGVLTAVVGAIDEVLKTGGKEVAKVETIVGRLCRFSPRNTPPLAFKKIASIIGRIAKAGLQYNTIDIGQFIQHALSNLQDHGNSESQVAASQALCKLARGYHLNATFSKSAVLPSLIPLLSGDCEELFVLAASVTPNWLCFDEIKPTKPAYFDISTIQHLIRLLSHKQDWVMACAARGIRNTFEFIDQHELPFFNELVESDGLRRLIELVSSQDVDTASAAAKAVKSFAKSSLDPWGPGDMSVMLIWEGVIQKLVPYLTASFDFHPMQETALKTILKLIEIQGAKDAFVQAGAVPDVIRLLNSCNGCHKAVVEIVCWLASPLPHSSHTARSALVNAGVATSLVQCLRTLTLREVHIDAVLSSVHHSNESYLAFKAAGAEGLLVDHLSTSAASSYAREQIALAIQLLQFDMATARARQATQTADANVSLFRRHLLLLTSHDFQEVVRAADMINNLCRKLSLIELLDIREFLIHLLNSQDPDTSSSAATLVSLLKQSNMTSHFSRGLLPMWEGIVPAIVPYLTPSFDSHTMQHLALKVLESLAEVEGVPEALVQAGVIPNLVRLATWEESNKDILIGIFDALSLSYTARSALIDAGIVQPLIQLVSSVDRDEVTFTIARLLQHSRETCIAFKAAGAEGIFVDYQPWGLEKEEFDNVIQLLRSV